MEQSQNEKPVLATTLDYRSNIDTSHPFCSVKDAVALFSERSLVDKIYSGKPSTPSHTVSSYSRTKLEETVNRLKIELEETKVELKLLKERGNEAEFGLTSLKAELHKNMSKLARAETATTSAASSRSIRGDDIDNGNIPREEEKKRERVVRTERNNTWLSYGEKEEGSFMGRRKERRLNKRKPIVPLIGDLLFRKRGSSSSLLSTSYASALHVLGSITLDEK